MERSPTSEPTADDNGAEPGGVCGKAAVGSRLFTKVDHRFDATLSLSAPHFLHRRFGQPR